MDPRLPAEGPISVLEATLALLAEAELLTPPWARCFGVLGSSSAEAWEPDRDRDVLGDLAARGLTPVASARIFLWRAPVEARIALISDRNVMSS